MSEGFHIKPAESKSHESGIELIANLRAAAEANDEAKIIGALAQIQKKINLAWGDASEPMNKPFYDKNQQRYRFSLSSGTSGTRFFFTLTALNPYPGKLIFPNVNMGHDRDGKTLDKAFEEVFGSAARNVNSHPSSSPFYVVDVLDS